MGSNKPIFFLLFVICSSLFSAALSRKLLFVEVVHAGTGNSGSSGGGDSLQCMQQLMPCRPYLKESNSNPPASTCCIPLKQAVANEPQCLCRVFKNQALMNSFNVTLNDAMALAKACGAHADLSVCKDAAASPKSPVIPSPPKGESPLSRVDRTNLTAFGFGRGGGGGGRSGGRSIGGEEPKASSSSSSSGRAVPSSSFPRGMPVTEQVSNAMAEPVPNLGRLILASTAVASVIVSLF